MPTLIDHYVMKDNTYEVELLQTDWPIPNVFCQNYYFGHDIQTTYDETPITHYVGGTDEALNQNLPGWLINWSQTQISDTNHFSYQILPMNDHELKSYTVNLQIINRDGKMFTQSFKIILFKIEKNAQPYSFAAGSDGNTVDVTSNPPKF